jgi:hypothetical protein
MALRDSERAIRRVADRTDATLPAPQRVGSELILWVDGPAHGECDFLSPGDTAELTGPATVFVVDEP